MSFLFNILSSLILKLSNDLFKLIPFLIFIMIFSILIINQNYLFVYFYISIFFISLFFSFSIKILDKVLFKLKLSFYTFEKFYIGIKKHYFLNNTSIKDFFFKIKDFKKNLSKESPNWNKQYFYDSKRLNQLSKIKNNIPHFYSNKKNFLNVVFYNSIFLLLLFILFSYPLSYKKPIYNKQFFTVTNEISNKEPLYVSNLPSSYSINSFLYQNFWVKSRC